MEIEYLSEGMVWRYLLGRLRSMVVPLCCLLVLMKVNLTHKNHSPTPGKTRYISKYWKEEVNCMVRRELFNDSATSVGISKIHCCLAK